LGDQIPRLPRGQPQHTREFQRRTRLRGHRHEPPSRGQRLHRLPPRQLTHHHRLHRTRPRPQPLTRPHHLTQLHITHPRQRHTRRETRPGHATTRPRSGGEALQRVGQVGARCHPGHRRIPPTPPVSDHHHRHTLIRRHQPRPTINRGDQVPPHPRINPITLSRANTTVDLAGQTHDRG